MKIKVSIIGLGYWGKNILRNLHDMGVLAKACDVSKAVLDARAKEYPTITFTGDVQSVMGDPAAQAVVIATPAATHYDLVKQSLAAGKDVFVEKPLALCVKEGAELLRLATKKGRILQVGHILQYHPAVIKLRQMILEGALGEVQYIYSNRLNIGKLRVEENILWSFAPHDISVILMLLGSEPVSVESFGASYVSKGIYDVTLTVLRFPGKIRAHIFVSWLHPFKEQKLVVVGSKAMAVFDDMTTEKLFIYPHRIEWENGKVPVARKAECNPVPIEFREPLREELTHFIECLKTRSTPKTDGEEGLRVLQVLEEAEESMKNYSARTSTRSDGVMIHPSACVDDNVTIGERTRIWHFTHVLKDSAIGKNCVIAQNVSIGPGVSIGDNVKIQNNVSVYKGVTLEDDVFCGPSAVFTNVFTPRAFIERKDEFLSTLVKKGASIGANATIVCGVTVGRYAFIGAGAVVTKDVPDYGLVIGVPARQTGWVCTCGVPLKKMTAKKITKCLRCGLAYKLQKGKIVSV
ncbi:MAG: Gfo/Idh/MocA family oxidoreductase [Candidatus Omnitrophica bacterium]|nr:Gfo/Idh/MocA family oxidoreductase [Candidatus Omnitrophota bacterium]